MNDIYGINFKARVVTGGYIQYPQTVLPIFISPNMTKLICLSISSIIYKKRINWIIDLYYSQIYNTIIADFHANFANVTAF